MRDITKLCDIVPSCDECPRYGDDCDGSAERLYTHEEAWGMCDLISRTDAICAVLSVPMPLRLADEIDEVLRSLPSAEAVDVVRCKDCRWYDKYCDVCHNPRYGDGYANYQPPYVDEDYWCKDGERKGGDDE